MKENIVDTFQAFLDSRLENIHTCIPGTIQSYDGHVKRTATVKPSVKLKALNGDDVELPLIANVPVILPSTGSFNLLFPIPKGTGCLILFSETGIGNFLNGDRKSVSSSSR